MNYQRISLYCDLSHSQAVEINLDLMADYFAFLYHIARTGGHTTEEEIFVENIAASLDVEPHDLAQAVKRSQNQDDDIFKAAERLRNSPLRNSAFLDACHLARLDGAVTAEEQFALKEAEKGLGVEKGFSEYARKLAASNERMLRIFCELAIEPDPADLWTVYLNEGMRKADRHRRMILSHPETKDLDQRIAVTAIVIRVAGIGWINSPLELTIKNLSRYLELQPIHIESAQARAWEVKASLLELAGSIKDRDLQLIALGDIYRVCISDTEFSSLEQELLKQLATSFGISDSKIQQLLELGCDELALSRSIGGLS